MLINAIDKFQTYRTDEEIMQYEKEKQKIINTIKLFMVGGAEYFYLNYYIDDDKFLNKTHVDKKEITRILNFSKDAKKHFEEGLLSEDEEICEMMKYRYLTDLIDWEKDKEIDSNMFRIFKYVADCITGNIGYMFSILYQTAEIENVDYNLIRKAESSVYHQLEKMFFFLGKEHDKSINKNSRCCTLNI